MCTWQRCLLTCQILQLHPLQSLTTPVSRCSATLVHCILDVMVPPGFLRTWQAHAQSEHCCLVGVPD